MKTRLLQWVFVMMVAAINFTACNDDEKPKTLPEVTTSAITNVTTTTASGGGEIISTGNASITARGLVYSSTNATPTIEDSKTEETETDDIFTSELEGLESGTTYHVRAYATNSVATGYGEVVDFMTGNAAPTASNILISGTVQVPEELTGTYTYNDSEGDVEGISTFKWYRANDAAGSGEAAIAGATALTYTLQDADEFKFIRFGVTPIAATGNTTGTEIKSAFVGPVAEEPTTVTFTYNGASVTYGIIISSTTGRRWLDRNLGAPNTPTGVNDFANYGDLFQWGRLADGHQLIIRAATSGGTTSVNGTTATQSTTDNPGNSLFITVAASPFDWRSPSNDNLWQGIGGINNPCPSGFRLATKAEWEAENIVGTDEGYTKLKLTTTGQRFNDAFISGVATNGHYWTSTIEGPSEAWFVNPAIPANGGGTNYTSNARVTGKACRCIKD